MRIVWFVLRSIYPSCIILSFIFLLINLIKLHAVPNFRSVENEPSDPGFSAGQLQRLNLNLFNVSKGNLIWHFLLKTETFFSANIKIRPGVKLYATQVGPIKNRCVSFFVEKLAAENAGVQNDSYVSFVDTLYFQVGVAMATEGHTNGEIDTGTP